MPPHHLPVLAERPKGDAESQTVFDILKPKAGDTVVDCTLGLGGHAKIFLEHIGPSGHFIGIDADRENLDAAKAALAAFPNVDLVHANFRELPHLQLEQADVIFADLGLSSPHVDNAMRGFSFRSTGPLDMRFDRNHGHPASSWIRQWSEHELASVFRDYGQFPGGTRLAKAIKSELKEHPEGLRTTEQLKAMVEKLFSWKAPSLMPQIFQALRIATNDEVGSIDILLHHAPLFLKNHGRFGVISYHSLEDQRVKRAFRDLCEAPRDPITGAESAARRFRLLTKKPLKPSDSEVQVNPRSRSAIFRAIERT